jgi:hypothetical protein
LNNNDKINILFDAIKNYYNIQLSETVKLDINEAAKILKQYNEMNDWLKELEVIINLESEKVDKK